MNALTSQSAPRPHDGGIVPFIQHRQLFTEDHPVRWKNGSAENSMLTPLFAKPFVNGITFWTTWEKLEPEEATYDWSPLDLLFAAVGGQGRFVNLGVMPAIYPEWLAAYEDGRGRRVEMFAYDDQVQGRQKEVTKRKPFPLDEVYLQRYYSLMSKLAERYRNQQALNHVVVGGPSNGTGFETAIHMAKRDINDVRTRVTQIAGETYDQALANAWIRATETFHTCFPNKMLSLALTVNMASLDKKVPRSERTARMILNQLERRGYDFVHPMTFNLTGKDWWRHYSDPNFAVARLLNLLIEAPQRGFTTGYQYLGISWANSRQEQRARPFLRALANGTTVAKAHWIEVWAEDVLADRSAWKTREWVDDRHPCLNGCEEGSYDDFMKALAQAYPR